LSLIKAGLVKLAERLLNTPNIRPQNIRPRRVLVYVSAGAIEISHAGKRRSGKSHRMHIHRYHHREARTKRLLETENTFNEIQGKLQVFCTNFRFGCWKGVLGAPGQPGFTWFSACDYRGFFSGLF